MRVGGKLTDVSASARAYQALEPDPTVGKRVSNAVQAVMDNLPGREVDVAERMTRDVATAMFSGQHRVADLPQAVREQTDSVARELYQEDFLDVFSEGNPKHAVLGAKKPVEAPPAEAPPAEAPPVKPPEEAVPSPDANWRTGEGKLQDRIDAYVTEKRQSLPYTGEDKKLSDAFVEEHRDEILAAARRQFGAPGTRLTESADEVADAAAPTTKLATSPEDAKKAVEAGRPVRVLLVSDEGKKGRKYYRIDSDAGEDALTSSGPVKGGTPVGKLWNAHVDDKTDTIDPAFLDELWDATLKTGGRTNQRALDGKFVELLEHKMTGKSKYRILKVGEAKPKAPAPKPAAPKAPLKRNRRYKVAEEAERLVKMMEEDPAGVAQQITDQAWSASVGRAVREPADLDEFMQQPSVAKYLSVLEESFRRHLTKMGAGSKLINIGSPNRQASKALWVPQKRAAKIQRVLQKFLVNHDFTKVYDRKTGLYTEEFSNALVDFVQKTTGKPPEFATEVKKGRANREHVNQAIFELKAHLAGKLAQVKYAVTGTSAGHRLIMDGLASAPGGAQARRMINGAAKSINDKIDLQLQDMPAPVQQVLEQVASRLRTNAEDLLRRAKERQAETAGDPVESVLAALDDPKNPGKYTTMSHELAEELLDPDADPTASIIAAFEGNRISLPEDLATELRSKLSEIKEARKQASLFKAEPAQKLQPLASEAHVVISKVHTRVTTDMRNAVVDLLEGVYPSIARSDLEAEVNGLGPDWIAKAWLEFFRDGKFGESFDVLARGPRGPRQGDELAAGVRYAVKRRLQFLKEDLVTELVDAGIAVKEEVAQAARRILNNKTEALTSLGIRESTMDAETYREAYRWLEQTGLWALQDAEDFAMLQNTKLRIPNEFARVLNEAARQGGRNPAEIHQALFAQKGDQRGKLRPLARLYSNLFNSYKRMQLGGLVIPNTVYHVTNMLDAVFMMHRNLGFGATVGVMRQAFTNPGIVGRVTMSLTSWTDIIGDSKGAFRLALFDKQRYPTMASKGPNDDYVRAPDGTVYTWDQLAAYAHENGLEATRARTELARDMAEDLRRRAAGTYMSAAKGGLVAWQRGIQEISHTVEVAARVGVMVDAIKKGKSLPEAVIDARSSLLDYGRMTQFEQGWMRMIFPFYAFNKANVQSFMRAALNNPQRIRQQLQGIQATWDAVGITSEERRNWSEYQTGRLALATLSEQGQVFRVDGSVDPRHRAIGLFSPGLSTPQALSLWYDFANLLSGGVLSSQISKPGAESEEFSSSFEDAVLGHVNPIAKLAVNAFKYYTGEDQRKRIDRKLVVSPTMMRTPMFSEFIETHFPVRKVYWDEDNEKWLDPELFVVTEQAKRALPAVYVIEGPAAQAAFISFVDIFGSELARPRDFFNWLGDFDSQMQYTRLEYLETEGGLPPSAALLPGMRREKLKSPQRIQQESQERRLADIEKKVTPIRAGTPF